MLTDLKVQQVGLLQVDVKNSKPGVSAFGSLFDGEEQDQSLPSELESALLAS